MVSSLGILLGMIDLKREAYQQKMNTFNKIAKEIIIPPYLYQKIRVQMKYGIVNTEDDKKVLFESLPNGIKNELVIKLFEKLIRSIYFFHDKKKSFLASICLALKPSKLNKNDIIYLKDDIAKEGKYFLN